MNTKCHMTQGPFGDPAETKTYLCHHITQTISVSLYVELTLNIGFNALLPQIALVLQG